MRIRRKFAWGQVIGAVVWMALSYAWVSKPHTTPGIRSAYLLTGATWTFLLLYCLLSYFFTWWDVDESGITERRIFSRKTIPWAELTRVGAWVPGKKPVSGIVEVEYHRAAPMSETGHLLLQPKQGERRDLLTQLLHFAPQATFDQF